MFLAIYTNYIKRYCDRRFFESVNKLGCDTYIVDNSINNYLDRLRSITSYPIVTIKIDKEPTKTLFNRAVYLSVDILRNIFLETDEEYFFILESDVIPPNDVLKKFRLAIDVLDSQEINWAAIGGLYHYPFHQTNGDKLQKTHHVLSGCTVYKREAIEKYPFKLDPERPEAFPDALFCDDVNKGGEYELYNYNAIVCEHIYKAAEERGMREFYGDYMKLYEL
jgi:hypothetical protein